MADSEPLHEDEHRKLTCLVRFVGAFIAFPALTTSAAFWIWEGFESHTLHVVGLGLAGAVGVLLIARAPFFAAKLG